MAGTLLQLVPQLGHLRAEQRDKAGVTTLLSEKGKVTLFPLRRLLMFRAVSGRVRKKGCEQWWNVILLYLKFYIQLNFIFPSITCCPTALVTFQSTVFRPHFAHSDFECL